MISHARRFIFVHIPKTGGTSIASHLFSFCETVIKHQFFRDLLNERRQDIDYYSFTVVRNPWDREVSRYFYQRQNPANEWNEEASKYDFKHWLKRRHRDTMFLEFMGAPMMNWIIDESGKVSVDYIARYEKLEEDWMHLGKLLGVPCDLPRMNVSSHGVYAEYYDRETRSMIEKVYERDIEYFGYSFSG